jgi:energy-coupling factor transporter transmembrane protein EcfT
VNLPKPKNPFGHAIRILIFALIGGVLGLAVGMPNTPLLAIPGIVLGLVAEVFARILLRLSRTLGLPRTLLLVLVPVLATLDGLADAYFLHGGGGTPTKDAIRNAYLSGGSLVLAVALLVAGGVIALVLGNWSGRQGVGRSRDAWAAIFIAVQIALTVFGWVLLVVYSLLTTGPPIPV